MSRALDKETAAALNCGDPEAAYRAISAMLTEPPSPSDSLLEIELLGRGHSLPIPSIDGGSGYFLRDGNAVAIHKLALAQAFFVARRILQRYRSVEAAPATASAAADAGSPSPPPSADDAMAATAVILLFDPEHLTAANTRKRIILSRAADVGVGVGAHTAAVAAAERRLVDSLLTSHLHRHTKSPTLWSHRRWLLASLSGAAADGEGEGEEEVEAEVEMKDVGARVVRDIVDVVMVAAVRHPRNYYAWSHARWLVMGTQGEGDSSVDAVAVALLPAVRDWCYRHHDDTSGWSFLLFLLLSLSTAEVAHLDETLSQVEHMAASLRWTGESVWAFLRTAAAAAAARRQTRGTRQARDYGHNDHIGHLQQTARTLQAGSGLDPLSQDWRVLQQAQDWLALAFTTTKP